MVLESMDMIDQWAPASKPPMISQNQIHVWKIFLDLTRFQLENLLRTLSADEIIRAGRFHFEKDKARFIAARGMLRQILADYIEADPQKIQFEYTANGKPLLSSTHSLQGLSFNLSHSGAFALCAVRPRRHVGIDIEVIRDDVAVMEIARRFFSKDELTSLERSGTNKMHDVFFQYWTRKEAFLKGVGRGISFPLEKVDVSLINRSGLMPLSVRGDKSEPTWYGQDLFPHPGYIAAIATDEANCNLTCLEYCMSQT